MKTAVVYDKWLHQYGGAELVACTMAQILKKMGWDVTFISGKYTDSYHIKEKFGIDLKDITFYEIWNHENDLKKLVEGKDLFINLSFMDYVYGYAKKNMYYTHFPTPIRSNFFNLGLDFFHITGSHVLLPKKISDRIYNRIRAGIFYDMEKRLDSYHIIFANSKFTQKWIKNYWNKDSVVLYPSISVHLQSDMNTKTEAVKERSGKTASVNDIRHNWIVSVGRFFNLGHGKKQEVLIEAFKRLTEAVKERSGKTASVQKAWELHLVGGVGNEPSSISFVEYLKKQSQGYPIYFHFNISHREVLQILNKSKLYWHATGYGENEQTNPVAFEHFGIAPVEAILFGCIPILYRGGGLPEILRAFGFHDEIYTFNSIDDLVQNSFALLSHEGVPKNKPHNPFTIESFTSLFVSYLNN